MNSKLALVSTENAALDAKQNELLGDTRKLAIEAIDRIMMGCPTKIEPKSRLIFKNIAKEAGISSTVLHREFRDVMSYVEVVKRKGTSHRTTVHAIDARKRCFDAIERIVNKAPYIISKVAKLNTANVAKEAEVDDSYIYQALPDVLIEIAKQQSEKEVFGNVETNTKLVSALHRLVESGQKVTVKDVCREAKMNKSFDVVVRKSYPDVHNAILDVIVEQKEKARSDERIALLGALERLRSGKPINTNPIPVGGYLSVKKLMEESGIHETTINRHHKDICKECTSRKRLGSDDVWFFNDGEVQLKGGTDATKLNFSSLPFDWLTESAKAFTKACHATRSSATLVSNLQAIRMFGVAVFDINSTCTPKEIDRSLMENVLYNWSKAELKESSIKRRLASLRQYIEWCEDTAMVEFGATRLIRDSDYPKEGKSLPKFIPEYIMSQLNANIDGLHPHVMRFFLVLQEVGMRISECCSLPYDCIYSDSQGDYFIKYYQYKMKKEHVVPITKETAAVIKEQQNEVVSEFTGATGILFPTPKLQDNKRPYPRAGKAWSKGTLIKNLNALAQERNIASESGSIYHFSFHMFRHTTATRMINNGVPQHIVQRYLGHESPTMTSIYAHIMDKTLKEEYAKFNGKMVDIKGAIYDVEDVAESLSKGCDADSIDAQWLKKNIAVQALPNGLCSLPVVQGSCPHANACLTCPNFRTDHRYLPQHKDQLNRTEEIIATCSSKGWTRQLEMNEKIKQSLVNIIEPLEVN
jgi:integrase